MKYFLLFSVILIGFACNLDKDRKLSDVELKELTKAHNDSVTIVDSFSKTKIYIPPFFDKETFDSATTIKFYELARATQGELKLLVNSGLITNEIVHIVRSYAQDNSDLLILMDKAGSMQDDIDTVKAGLKQIIDAVSNFKELRLAIALYGDKNFDGDEWFSFKNFENNYREAKTFINNIEVTGGEDYPESVYDGFFKACEQNFWRQGNKRMIILIGDAPPQEKPLSDYTINDVIKKATQDKVTMNFYPIVVTPYTEVVSEPSAAKTYVEEKIITSLYPNPSNGIINVKFTANDSYTIQLFNSAGESILTEPVTGDHWQKDVSRFGNGAYILRAINKDKKFEVIKLIVYK